MVAVLLYFACVIGIVVILGVLGFASMLRNTRPS